MNVLNILNLLIPGPVKLFYEALLSLYLRLTGAAGIAILMLSLTVCLLATPLRPANGLKIRDNGFRLPKLWLMQLVCLLASWQLFSGARVLRGAWFGPISSLEGAGGFFLFWAGYAVFAVLRRVTGLGYHAMELNPRQRKTDRRNRILLVCCCLYLALLTGLLIPSEILSASPGEFTDAHYFQNPDRYLLFSGVMAAGMFVFWGTVYGLMLSPKARKRYVTVLACLAAVSAADYMLFGRSYGIISSSLQYETSVWARTGESWLNAGCILLLTAAVIVIRKKWPAVLRIFCLYGCAALTVMSVINISSLETKTAEIREISERQTGEKASFRLSRNGKNVVVIMLDRAINAFVPYMLNEKPELMRQFDGFTWYPNTLSYGYHTNIAAPALFGGYEYTPEELEKRADSLKDKHNEALKVMPAVFLENGYEVTVCDAPYANYQWVPDMSIYDGYPAVRTWNTIGMFDEYKAGIQTWLNGLRERNLFCYSLFRCAPVALQPALYDGGNWLSAGDGEEDSGLFGISPDFVKSYTVMQNLPLMTKIDDGNTDTFLMLTNEMTHNVIDLQEPDYVPARHVDNSEYESEHHIRRTADGKELDLETASELLRIHYHGDMSAFLLLGKWFDELREQGVWDNTKIILVSDHGCYLGLTGVNLSEQDPDLPDVPGYEKEQWADTTCYNPLLMVKDFGAEGFATDRTFMTNADTPVLAFEQAAENPVNPFTGKPVTSEAKGSGTQRIVESAWDIMTNTGRFFSDPLWITFRGNDVFDPENWSVEKRN